MAVAMRMVAVAAEVVGLKLKKRKMLIAVV